MIDWRRLKQSYLLFALLFLSTMMIVDGCSWNPWVLFGLLIIHSYLAVMEDTFSYLFNLINGKPQRQPVELNPNFAAQPIRNNMSTQQLAFNYNPPSYPTAVRDRVQPYDFSRERSKTLSNEQSLVIEKTRHERMTNLKEFLQKSDSPMKESRSGNQHKENTGSLNKSGYWRSPQPDVSQFELEMRHQDMQLLKKMHQDTLQIELMQHQWYLRGLENTVHLLALFVQRLSDFHQKNIEALNELLLTNFGLELVVNGQQRYRSAQPVDFDEVLNAASCFRTVKVMKWKWQTQLPTATKIAVATELARLASERAELDNYIYFEGKDKGPNYRELAISRLRTIVGELLPSHTLVITSRQQAELNEISDKLLLFTFFRHALNRMILAMTTQHIRVRWQEQCKHRDNSMTFLFDWRDSGIFQINIAADRIYYCEPGDNNIFSAFYMYFYILKVRHRDALRLNPELEQVVERTVQ